MTKTSSIRSSASHLDSHLDRTPVPPALRSKLDLEKISPLQLQVERVVNKSRRQGRQSSLLTTPIRQSTSCGCLLQVGPL